MTDSELIKRLWKSRVTMADCMRRLLVDGNRAAESQMLIAMAEIERLNGWQAQFPRQRDHIDPVLSAWREAEAKLKAMMR
jgi:hypothetical protein